MECPFICTKQKHMYCIYTKTPAFFVRKEYLMIFVVLFKNVLLNDIPFMSINLSLSLSNQSILFSAENLLGCNLS